MLTLRDVHTKNDQVYSSPNPFVVFSDLKQLQEHFPIDKALSEITPNYNVAPTQEILTIISQEGLNLLEKLHWGLVPHWAKDITTGYKMINARVETVASKPSFRDGFKKRRCLVLADGFYEWKGEKGQKLPFFITLPDEKPFAFAGLWETWRDIVPSCLISQFTGKFPKNSLKCLSLLALKRFAT